MVDTIATHLIVISVKMHDCACLHSLFIVLNVFGKFHKTSPCHTRYMTGRYGVCVSGICAGNMHLEKTPAVDG